MSARFSSPVEKKEEKRPSPMFALLLLKLYGETMRFNQGKRLTERRYTPSGSSGTKKLSTIDIMRIARSRLLQCKAQNMDVISNLINASFDVNSGISYETNEEDLKLAILLHASALKVYNQEFDHARKLITICKHSSSVPQNPVQKVVLYFSEALERRITSELRLGIVSSKNPEGNQMKVMPLEEALTNFQPVTAMCEQDLPFCIVSQYTAIQSILENVGSARKIHLIDLGVRSGSHWTVLMQGLEALGNQSEYPLEMLKLTVIGTSKETSEKVGNHLSSFAETMKIPFQFKSLVSDMKNLKQDMFETEADEAIVVHSEMRLSCFLAWPDRLESLLQIIANLHPCVMVILEPEADTNASDFMERFDETVSLASSVLNCLEDVLDKESPCRERMEKVLIKESIQNIIMAEGEDRVCRHNRIGTWRKFMEKFGLVELPMSGFALNLAGMLVNHNPRWGNCTLDSDGKCLIVGWRSSPIKSISVWKYQNS